jgi:hypothetical protein
MQINAVEISYHFDNTEGNSIFGTVAGAVKELHILVSLSKKIATFTGIPLLSQVSRILCIQIMI